MKKNGKPKGRGSERAENLNGPWLPIAMTSPAFATSSNASAFFRLRR